MRVAIRPTFLAWLPFILLGAPGCPGTGATNAAPEPDGPTSPEPDACAADGNPCAEDAFDSGSESDPGNDGPESDGDTEIVDAANDGDAGSALDAGPDGPDDGDGTSDAPRIGDASDGAQSDENSPVVDAADAGNPFPCDDGEKNGKETDVDCGGPTCSPCDLDRACESSRDCRTGNCGRSVCTLASGPPNWLPGVPISTPRSAFAASIQATGNRRANLVAIGGRNEQQVGAPDLDTYETIDTEGSAWTSAKLPGPRQDNAAATGPDGKVYLFGTVNQPTWVYDGGWITWLAPMPSTCSFPPAVALGGDNLFYVGCNPFKSTGMSDVINVYDPVSDVWSTLAKPKPTPLNSVPAVVTRGSRVYFLGGTVARGTLESYDVATGTWSSHAPLLDRYSAPAVLGPDGRIYAIGGTTQMSDVAIVAAYSPESDRWSPVAPLTLQRVGHALAVGPDGRIYALGGNSGTPQSRSTSSVEVYGPVVSVSTKSATPGATVVVNGRNFAASSKVSLYLGSTAGTLLATGTTTPSGELVPFISFTAPGGVGATYLTIIDDKSRFPITLSFAVN